MGRPVSVITSPRSGGSSGTPSPPRGAPPAPGGVLPPSLPPLEPPQPPRRRWGWLRIVLGAAIVLLCAAGGTAVFVLEQVQSVSDALRQNSSLKVGNHVLAQAVYGGPETLLLVGDDTRKGFKYYHGGFVPDLANEMLLVRLDPNEPYITMMSIPRELQAQVYSAHGRPLYVNRLNSAYAHGIGSLVETIKLDYGLSIDHVLVATFASFKNAVNQMGCVYSTIDQRYYNLNTGAPGTNYQSIDLQPGYQKLCGEHALEFVSFRHTDTSLVRDARDQSFLLDVKKQYGPTLLDNIGKFEQIFGRAVVTDASLKSNTQILSLASTLASMSSRSVRDVQFQVNLQPTGSNPCNCDTATPQQIHYSVYEFLHGGQGLSKQSVAKQAQAVHGKHGAARLPLVPTLSSAMAQARAAAAKTPFPLEYPRVEDRGGSWQAPDLRVYNISGPGNVNYPAYVSVFYDGGLGNYYDVQGTTWTTAPQFDSPDYTKVKVGARNYNLYLESSHIKMIAWYENDAVYWVRNSLTNSVPNGEMLAIAEDTQPFVTSSGGKNSTPVILRAAKVPFPTTAKKPTNTKLLVGGAAGLVTLIALPLLLILGIRRFLDLRKPRVQLANGQVIGDRLPLAAEHADDRSPVPLLAPLVVPDGAFAGDLPPGVLPRLQGTVHWVGTPTVYKRFNFRGAKLAITLLVVLAVLGGAAAAYVLTRHQAAAAPPVHHVKRVVVPLVPTVPVVVLNDTTVAGAAGRLAASLRADRIKVPLVANVSETLPPGNVIFYAPGERTQAQRLRRLLPKQVSTVAPIDPVVAAAAGGNAQLVVAIT
jgi:LCP family protein required for cell wall assembly